MRWWVIGAVLAAFAVGAFVVLRAPGARAGTAVIGDAAPAILEATGWTQALPLRTAGVTVVAVEDWSRLRYIADMAALCGGLCAGDAALVRIVDMAPGGSRKVVFVRLGGWPRAADGDGLDMACLSAALTAEAALIGAPDAVPTCAGAVAETRTRWALPLGLGTV